MAKLFTNHDPFHIHKVLGLLALINFAYRLISYPWRGYSFCSVDNEACSEKEIKFDIACVLLHAVLGLSSLLMPVPKKRNFKAPMIWIEHRLHSLIFGSRAIIGTLLSIMGLWPEHWALGYATKLGLIMATCFAADLTTKLYGSREQRTTNAMVYPDYITPGMQQKIKLNYSMAQMVATISCIVQDPSMNFLSLYAIQGVAFVMTLRRKGLCSTRAVHMIYQYQLFAMYVPHFAAIFHKRDNNYFAEMFLMGALQMLAGHLRIDRLQSKLRVWGMIVAIYQTFHCIPACWDVLLWFHTHPAGIAYVIYAHANEYQRTLRHYIPILVGRAVEAKDASAKAHPIQSLSRDMNEYDLVAYPDRRQRFLMVFAAMLGTHFQGIEVGKQAVESFLPGMLSS